MPLTTNVLPITTALQFADATVGWMAECSVDDCQRPTHARGVCSSHYHRVLANLGPGEKRVRVLPGATVAERVAAHSHPDEHGHLIWDGLITHPDRPAVAVTKPEGGRRLINVRAAQLDLAGVKRPAGQAFARVGCGVTRCIHPDHMYWDNRRRGALVSAEVADRLIVMHQAGSLHVSDTADMLNVSRDALYNAMHARGYDLNTRKFLE